MLKHKSVQNITRQSGKQSTVSLSVCRPPSLLMLDLVQTTHLWGLVWLADGIFLREMSFRELFGLKLCQLMEMIVLVVCRCLYR
jgi:hypothetical protein